jgi:hypothetical protein
MNLPLIIGAGLGIALGISWIIYAEKKQKNENDPIAKIKSAAESIDKSQGEVTSSKPKTRTFPSTSSFPNPSSFPKLASLDEVQSEENEASSNIKKKIEADEEEEAVALEVEKKEFAEVLKNFMPITQSINSLDTILKHENFEELIRIESNNKIIVSYMTNLKDLYENLNNEAKKIKQMTLALININDKLISDAKEIEALDDKSLIEAAKEIISDTRNLDNEYSETLRFATKFEEQTSKCADYCDNMIQYTKEIILRDNESASAIYLHIFGNNGPFYKLKTENGEILTKYYGAIIKLKRIAKLVDKLRIDGKFHDNA